MTPEVLELEPDAPALGPPDIADAFHEALRVVLEDHEQASQSRRELVEGDASVDVPLVTLGAPDDLLVGHLFQDVGFPLPVGPQDLRLPRGLGLLFLVPLDVLHLLHEAGEVLVLRPLVVDRAQWGSDVDRLDDVGGFEHVAPTVSAATAATERLLRLVLHAGQATLGRLEGGLDRGRTLRFRLTDLLGGLAHDLASARDVGELVRHTGNLFSRPSDGTVPHGGHHIPQFVLETVDRKLVE